MTHNYTRRRKFTPSQRVAFFRDHAGICYLCGMKIVPAIEAWEIEHVIARELLGPGADEDDNLALAHKKCHALKTKADRQAIAKSNHVQAKNMGARPPSQWPKKAKAPRRQQRRASTPISGKFDGDITATRKIDRNTVRTT